MDITGGVVASTSAISATHCQFKCQNRNDCNFFSFKTGSCYLKSTGTPMTPSEGCVSGPKVCDYDKSERSVCSASCVSRGSSRSYRVQVGDLSGLNSKYKKQEALNNSNVVYRSITRS